VSVRDRMVTVENRWCDICLRTCTGPHPLPSLEDEAERRIRDSLHRLEAYGLGRVT
jgi:hypothetical protein